MIERIINYLKDKKIIILGFGLEGVSTYKFIRKYLKEQKIYIADRNDDVFKNNELIKDDKNVELIYGESYLENLESYDIIMKTPGVSFAFVDIENYRDKIKSQIELLLEFTDSLTIGITGTKGKSTTSSLIYKMLSDQNKQTVLLGNIGVPVFDFIEDIESDTIIVLELSSHQLEYLTVSPKISIILNIYEEHLDHYKTLQHYIDAKINICKFQTKNNILLYNADNEIINQVLKKNNINSRMIKICNEKVLENDRCAIVKKDNFVNINGMKLYDCRSSRNLLGNHNLCNIMFVLGISELLGLDLNQSIKTINTFDPLPHRMEFVGNIKGILYYNDAIATIPQSTISTIETLKNVSTLIIGGMDRKINYNEFIKFLNRSCISNLVCMPDTGHKIADKIDNSAIRVFKVNSMKEAVDIAKKHTEKNKICLLSPAASSYGLYKNFQEKGNEFKRLVMN